MIHGHIAERSTWPFLDEAPATTEADFGRLSRVRFFIASVAARKEREQLVQLVVGGLSAVLAKLEGFGVLDLGRPLLAVPGLELLAEPLGQALEPAGVVHAHFALPIGLLPRVVRN